MSLSDRLGSHSNHISEMSHFGEFEEDLDEIRADLVSAVQQGDYDTVSSFFSGRSSLASQALVDREGVSLLHWAALNNRRRIASFLLAKSSYYVNYRKDLPGNSLVNAAGGILGETPLHWAVRRQYYAMMDFLLKNHASLDYKSVYGLDALHIAIRGEDIPGVYLLLSWGSDVNSRDISGDTCLLWLAKHRRLWPSTLHLSRLLLLFHADLTLPDSLGNT